MIEFNAELFCALIAFLERCQSFRFDPTRFQGETISSPNLDLGFIKIPAITDFLKRYELRVSSTMLGKLIDLMNDNPDLSLDDFAEELHSLRKCIESELRDHPILFLQEQDVDHMSTFRNMVKGSRIPSKTQKEILEASFCMAHGHHTACVFHLMRTLDSGLRRIKSRMKYITLPDSKGNPSWGTLLKAIDDEIAARKKPNVTLTNSQRKSIWFFEEASKLLRLIKNSWRNSTMHPDRDYTAKEARTIYEATVSFLAFVFANLRGKN